MFFGLSLLFSQMSVGWKAVALAGVAVILGGWFLSGVYSSAFIASCVSAALTGVWGLTYWSLLRKGVLV